MPKAQWAPLSATVTVPGRVGDRDRDPGLLSFSWGDGTSSTCQGPGTPYVSGASDPSAASPTCGHTYQVTSAAAPGQQFPVTATLSLAGSRGTAAGRPGRSRISRRPRPCTGRWNRSNPSSCKEGGHERVQAGRPDFERRPGGARTGRRAPATGAEARKRSRLGQVRLTLLRTSRRVRLLAALVLIVVCGVLAYPAMALTFTPKPTRRWSPWTCPRAP
jgi:hypothetical protein